MPTSRVALSAAPELKPTHPFKRRITDFGHAVSHFALHCVHVN